MAAGNFDLAASIPAGVTLAGDGADKTTLIPVDENGTQIETYKLSSDNVTLKDMTITTDDAEDSKYANPLSVTGENVVLDGIHLVRTVNLLGSNGNGVDLKASEGDVTLRNSTIDCGVRTNSIPGNILIENSTLTANTGDTYSLSIGASATGTLRVKDSMLQRPIDLGQNTKSNDKLLGLQSATFDNCKFTAKASGNRLQDRIATGVNTTFTNCEFDSGMMFVANYCKNNPTYTFTNCKVNGVALTAENYSSLITWDVVYGTVIINGTTVTVSQNN